MIGSGAVGQVVAAERLVLRRARMTWIGPALLIAYIIVVFFASEIAARNSFIGLESGFFLVGAVLSGAGYPLLLAAVLFAAFRISREFSLGTIVNSWSRPLSRQAWFVGKIAAIEASLTMFFLLTVIVAVVLAAARFGFADLLEKDYLVHTSEVLWGRLAHAAALSLWGLLCVGATVAALAVFINQPGGTIAAGVAIGLVFAVGGAVETISNLLAPTFVLLPWEQFSAMSKGLPLPHEWGELTTMVLARGAIWALAAILIGLWGVRRKEIDF